MVYLADIMKKYFVSLKRTTVFLNRFQIGSLMHRCGVRKHQGHSVRALAEAIFTRTFVGKNFFQVIVINEDLPFGKDAAYRAARPVGQGQGKGGKGNRDLRRGGKVCCVNADEPMCIMRRIIAEQGAAVRGGCGSMDTYMKKHPEKIFIAHRHCPCRSCPGIFNDHMFIK